MEELVSYIRDALEGKCSARSLDDEDDFEAVMEEITQAIFAWVDDHGEAAFAYGSPRDEW